MGEAFITRGGGSAGGSSSSDSNFITEIFTSNTLWKVPNNLKDGNVSVMVFGGGYAGDLNSGGVSIGGCGGYMNNAIINISGETHIPITIGEGSKAVDKMNVPNTAGTTSFGSYIYAAGASKYGGGSGCGGTSTYASSSYGKDGAQFGGGGGACAYNRGEGGAQGGNGGKYGGGGGAAYYFYTDSNNYTNFPTNCGIGGTYGGNGGTRNRTPKNGTNTIGKNLDFEGAGIAGTNICYEPWVNNNHITISSSIYNGGHGGGGGYGGNGGNGSYSYRARAGGGGGGYGANGGNGIVIQNNSSIGYAFGGGGGGYGGDGGDAGYFVNNNSSIAWSSGGGGGYGKFGKGGGYHNKVLQLDGGYAAGGYGRALVPSPANSSNTIYDAGNGGSGICIIQYYIK